MAITNYTYFDQFSDIEVDLTPYLQNINSKSDVDYSFTNLQSVKTTLKNLFERVELISDFKKNILYFDSYQIQDGERPEDVSFKKYNTTDNWWILCIFNDIKNLWMDWPMTNEQLQSMANKLSTTKNLYSEKAYHDLLSERNENLRNILVVKSFYLNDFTTAFRNAVGN